MCLRGFSSLARRSGCLRSSTITPEVSRWTIAPWLYAAPISLEDAYCPITWSLSSATRPFFIGGGVASTASLPAGTCRRPASTLQGAQVRGDRRQPTLEHVAGAGVAEAEGVLLVEGRAGHHEGAVEVEHRPAECHRRHRVLVADQGRGAGPRPHVMKPRLPGQPVVDHGEVAAYDLQVAGEQLAEVLERQHGERVVEYATADGGVVAHLETALDEVRRAGHPAGAQAGQRVALAHAAGAHAALVQVGHGRRRGARLVLEHAVDLVAVQPRALLAGHGDDLA